MKKLGIAALAAAGAMAVATPGASAADIPGPCERVSDLFATAHIYVEPLPEPVGPVVGTAVRTACGVTG